MLGRWFLRVVLARPWAAFLVMGAAFLAFGAGSLNLFFVFKANLELLIEHGWLAAMDGGLAQLVELLVTGYASMAAYLVFKACEHRLVHGLVAPAPSSSLPSNPLHEDRHPSR